MGEQFQPERHSGAEPTPAVREAPMMPGTDYRGFEHPLLKLMVETDMDPGQVHSIGAAWDSLGETLVAFRDAVVGAVGRSEGDWGGAAGDAARRYFSGVGEWMGQTGEAFHLAAYRLRAQSESAASAKSQMPEPVDFSMDDAMAMLRDETNLYHLADTVREINQRFAEKQQAHERAAEVMAAYAKSITETGAGMPEFAPVPAMGQVPAESPARSRSAVEHSAKPPVGGQEGDHGTVSWPGRSAPPENHASEKPEAGSADDRRRAGTDDPGGTSNRSAVQPFGPAADPQRSTPAPAADPQRPPVPSPPTGSPTPGGLPVPGAPVLGTGPGKPGGGHSPGPGRLGFIGHETGIRGAGLATAHGDAHRSGGVGMAPFAGRVRDEEERERQRPEWLLEPDADGVFGADVETAPPVLGED